MQREPAYGAPSTEKTEFRILYDEKTLYIGVWVWDSEPSEIMGSEMKRDAGIFDFAKSVTGLGGEAVANDPGLLNIFYTRRIGLVDGQQVPIIGGGRLTGRVGGYAIGVLNIATEEERGRRCSSSRTTRTTA